jgi:hypothetical protein
MKTDEQIIKKYGSLRELLIAYEMGSDYYTCFNNTDTYEILRALVEIKIDKFLKRK